MKIKEIKIYNIHNQIKNLDRYLDPSLLPQPLETFIKEPGKTPKFSWSIDTTVSMNLIINTKKRPNYVAIKSNFYTSDSDTYKWSYWFIKETNQIESDKAFRYELHLDSILTFGKDFLEGMKGKEVKINRWHEDRYIIKKENNNYILEPNENNISLINSDFKVGDTRGQSVEYLKIDDSRYHQGKTDVNFTSPGLDGVIDNKTNEQFQWYQYAVFNVESDIVKYASVLYEVGVSQTIQLYPLRYLLGYSYKHGIGVDRMKILVPFGGQNIEHGDGLSFPLLINSIDRIMDLGAGVVSSIFLSPYPLHSHIDFSNILKTKHVGEFEWYKEGIPMFIYNGSDTPSLTHATIRGAFQSRYLGYVKYDNSEDGGEYGVVNAPNHFVKGTQYGSAFVGFSFPFDSKLGGTERHLGTYDFEINKFIPTKNTPLKSEISKFLSSEESEIGFWHNNIFSNKLIIKSYNEAFEIQSYNYLKKPFIKLMLYPDNQGLFLNLNISDFTYFEGDLNTNVNVMSSAGATYLNNNRHFIEAQKEGVRIQQRLDIQHKASEQISHASSFSLFNPSTWFSSGAHMVNDSLEYSIIADKADNQIKQINAHIQDAKMGPPSVIEGSGNSGKMLETYEFKTFLTQELKKPNKTIRDLIYFHYNKFGYKVQTFKRIPNKNKWYKNRRKFNYLQIENARDYYNPSIKLDETIIGDITMQLGQGVRLWWQNKVEYDRENYEIAIEEFLKNN